MSIKGRLDKLESAQGSGRIVVIWKHHDETSESAMARWRVANPEQPDPNSSGLQVCLVRWAAPSMNGATA